MTNCKDCRSHLSDLLLDDAYVAAHPELAGHLAACAACRTELAELRSTFALLDTWEAPEPSPFFDSRLHARLREAVAAEPEGFWERTRSFLLFSTGRQFRPAMTGALAFALLLGGGTFVTQDPRQQRSGPAADGSASRRIGAQHGRRFRAPNHLGIPRSWRCLIPRRTGKIFRHRQNLALRHAIYQYDGLVFQNTASVHGRSELLATLAVFFSAVDSILPAYCCDRSHASLVSISRSALHWPRLPHNGERRR